MGESYPTGMNFTCAPTVRLRSESCPLTSRNRAVARTVTMEWPPTPRRFEPAPMDCMKPLSCCCVRGALRRSCTNDWMAKGARPMAARTAGAAVLASTCWIEPKTERQSASPARGARRGPPPNSASGTGT